MRGVAHTDVVITGFGRILYNNIIVELLDPILLMHCLFVFALSLKMAINWSNHVGGYIL